MKTLTIICPVYNEEELIRDFYLSLKEVVSELSDRYHINVLFVVDRGDDATLDILKDIANQESSVQILALSSRFGHQMSLLAGIDHCNSDALIMMDSDLQHPPSLIPKMLSEFEKGYEVVYTLRQDAIETGFFKKISSRIFYRLINRLSKIRINESAADFRLISRRVAKVFREQIREQNQFLRGLVSWVGFRSIGISYQADARKAGKSKYSFMRMIRFGAEGILSFSKKPLQASIFVGFGFAFLALLYSIIVFVQFFFYDELPSGWTTLTILISMFSGVQLIFLGIIGQYIGAIFDEVKGRPHYIIEEKINFDVE